MTSVPKLPGTEGLKQDHVRAGTRVEFKIKPSKGSNRFEDCFEGHCWLDPEKFQVIREAATLRDITRAGRQGALRIAMKEAGRHFNVNTPRRSEYDTEHGYRQALRDYKTTYKDALKRFKDFKAKVWAGLATPRRACMIQASINARRSDLKPIPRNEYHAALVARIWGTLVTGRARNVLSVVSRLLRSGWIFRGNARYEVTTALLTGPQYFKRHVRRNRSDGFSRSPDVADAPRYRPTPAVNQSQQQPQPTEAQPANSTAHRPKHGSAFVADAKVFDAARPDVATTATELLTQLDAPPKTSQVDSVP